MVMENDDREEYTVVMGGVEHTVKLTPEEAERYGDAATKASTPQNKSAVPQNKSAVDQGESR